MHFTPTMITIARLMQMMQAKPTSHWTAFGRRTTTQTGLSYVCYEGFGGLWIKQLGAHFTAEEYWTKCTKLFLFLPAVWG